MILTEGEVRFDARYVGFIEDQALPELTFALRSLQPKKVAA